MCSCGLHVHMRSVPLHLSIFHGTTCGPLPRRRELLSKLSSGTTVIADRYAFSGVAFTAAKGAPGLTRSWCQAPDTGLPAPDVVFFMRLPPDVAAARGGYGGERYEEAGFQAKVRLQFDALAGDTWHDVDASREVSVIHDDLKSVAQRIIDRAAAGMPLSTLWEGMP